MKSTFAVLACALLTMGGCASYDGRGLVPGQATAADVEAQMGAPKERLKAADGDTILFFARQPYGRQQFAARIAPDGRLRSIEQTLTEQNLRRLVSGATTKAQAREIIGPPWNTSWNERMQREAWEYTMYNSAQNEFYLYLQFSPDGILRESILVEDYYKQQGGASFN